MTAVRRRRWVALAVLLALLGTGGCAEEPQAGTDPVPAGSPLADCGALQAPPPRAEAGSSASSTSPELPDLTLPCFTGGEQVGLAELAGPAVINLWASWCGPCRAELPVLQRFADRAGERVHVVGVVTQDSRSRAAAFATDARITFPALLDRDGQLLARVPAVGLPATLFVDRDGRVRHLHNAQLDGATLERFAAEHLGVGLP